MDKEIMVADSFRSEQECCAEGINTREVLEGAESCAKVQKNGVLNSTYFVFSSHMGPRERLNESVFFLLGV
ncbi:hypothetical protein TNCV_720831 [Trichonephila clavipes]|nr:hypothetical protein TNCV_720831 [Trichonephila clavipes]